MDMMNLVLVCMIQRSRNNPQIRGNEGETEAISGKFAQNKGKGRKIPDSKNIKNEPKYP